MDELHPKRRKISASSTQTRTATRHFDKADCFVLIVGSERREILVHANYMAQESEVFKDWLTEKGFIPNMNTLVLPNIDHATMTDYITFAYIEKLPTAHLVGPVCETFTGDEYLSLAHLYFLGERFQNQTLKQATLAEIRRISTLLDIDTVATFPGLEDIHTIYRGTCKGDPARRLMVEMIAEGGSGQWLTPECNQSFILDLARKLLNRGREPLQFPRRSM